MNKIEIYTNETCGYCKQVKEELSKNNIEFEEKDTLEYKRFSVADLASEMFPPNRSLMMFSVDMFNTLIR